VKVETFFFDPKMKKPFATPTSLLSSPSGPSTPPLLSLPSLPSLPSLTQLSKSPLNYSSLSPRMLPSDPDVCGRSRPRAVSPLPENKSGLEMNQKEIKENDLEMSYIQGKKFKKLCEKFSF
jgi:hypothetical protein